MSGFAGQKCLAPGCPQVMGPRSASGTCRAHNHGPWCACQVCLAKRGADYVPPAAAAEPVAKAPARQAEAAPTPGAMAAWPGPNAHARDWLRPVSGLLRPMRDRSAALPRDPFSHLTEESL